MGPAANPSVNILATDAWTREDEATCECATQAAAGCHVNIHERKPVNPPPSSNPQAAPDLRPQWKPIAGSPYGTMNELHKSAEKRYCHKEKTMVYDTTTLTDRDSDAGPKPTLGIPSSRAHLAEHLFEINH